MSLYIKPIPPHSGLTSLVGGNSQTGEFYHLTRQEHSFMGLVFSGNSSLSATTYYSGNTPLNDLLGGVQVFVQSGLNTFTAGTTTYPIVGVVGSPVFTAVTALSIFSNLFSGNTIYSGASELGGLLAQAYAPISVVPTYVQPGVNTTTGGTISRPVVHVAGSPVFTAVTASSLSGTSVSATTFSSGSTELSVALSNKFNSEYAPISVQNQWAQPGNNITTGGTLNAPSVSLVASPSVFNLISSGVTFAPTISGNTLYSGASELGGLLAQAYAPISVVPTYVQNGIGTFTGGTPSRPTVNVRNNYLPLSGGTGGDYQFTGQTTTENLSVVGTVDAESLILSSVFYHNGLLDPGIMYADGTGEVHAKGSVFYFNDFENKLFVSSITGTSISASTYYSGNTLLTTSLTNLFNSFYAPISVVPTYVAPGVNTYTGGTITRPIIGVVGSPSFTAVTAANFISGSTNLNQIFAPIGSIGASTYVQPGNNIATGGTLNAPSVSLVASPSVFNLISSGVTFAPMISGNTIYSGASELGGLLAAAYAPISVVPTYVQPGVNVTTGGTVSRPIIHVSGSPVFNSVFASALSGTSVSATTFSSGATELSIALANKFNSAYAPISVQNQWVQPGNNITTGGTPNAPSLSLAASPSVLNLISSGVTYAPIISGGTIYSGNTDLGHLLGLVIGGSATYVQPGLNTTTGGTANAPIVHVAGSPVFTAVTAVAVSGTSVSATTFVSGSTELSVALANKFNSAYAPISVQNQWVQPGNNISTGGTANSPIVNLVPSPSVLNLLSSGVTYATTLSGNTIYSGVSELGGLLAAAYAPISVQNRYVQPGNNTSTGGTAIAPIVSLVASPSVFNLISSGVTFAPTISGNTLYSGASELGSLLSAVYAPISVNDQVVAHSVSLATLSAATASNTIGLSAHSATLATLSAQTASKVASVSAGLNVYVGGTAINPIVGLEGEIILTALTASHSTVTSTIVGENTGNGYGIQGIGTTQPGVFSYSYSGVAFYANTDSLTEDLAIFYNQNLSGLRVVNDGGLLWNSPTGLETTRINLGIIDTYVQPGINTYTGGTASRPVVGIVGSPVFTGITALVISGTSISASTLYSGSTSLGALLDLKLNLIQNLDDHDQIPLDFHYFATFDTIEQRAEKVVGADVKSWILGSVIPTYVQQGNNISTGGTETRPTVNLVASPSVLNLLSSGVTYATTLSGNTLYSGASELGGLLAQAYAPISVVPTYVQPGTNITTGGTISRPIVHVAGSPSFTSVTASNFISGSTNLSDTFASTGHTHVGGITFVMDGGGSVISTGQKGYLISPYAGTITGWTIISDGVGSIVVDVWKDTYANYPPTIADTISGSEKATLSSANKNTDTNLTTWTTSFSAGDIFTINVDSVSTVTKVTLLLHTIKLD